MIFIIGIVKITLNIIYSFLKLFPTQKKIVFLSRQSNQIPLDFRLIIDELKEKKYKIVVLCHRLEKQEQLKNELFKFVAIFLKSMYHLATSKVCIIDSYLPAVSLLKHKKNLTVIQIWHAMGKIKQSGYQTLGKKAGRNPKIAKVLNMHKNYDIVVAGAPAWNFAYCASFNIDESKLWNIGLPRAAYIYNNQREIQKQIYKKYPELRNKKIVLYSPTFRYDKNSKLDELINNFNYDKFALIITCHPNQKLNIDDKKVYRCKNINIYKLLTICDYFITDYSSLAVEAAALNKKTYYYLFDYDDYIESNGLNFDPLKELPTISFKNAKDLLNNLEKENYDIKTLNEYRSKYVPRKFNLATKKIVNYIEKKMN